MLTKLFVLWKLRLVEQIWSGIVLDHDPVPAQHRPAPQVLLHTTVLTTQAPGCTVPVPENSLKSTELVHVLFENSNGARYLGGVVSAGLLGPRPGVRGDLLYQVLIDQPLPLLSHAHLYTGY